MLAEFAKQSRLLATSDLPTKGNSRGMLLAFVGNLVLRGVSSYVAQQAGKFFAAQAAKSHRGRSTMTNRIPDYLPAASRQDQASQPAFQELRDLAQKQIADRMRQVATYVQEHPATGIGAAFCLGIFLGWVIKRR